MLKQLSNRLHFFLAAILMVIITLILCFSFWNTWQAREVGDMIYIQRMASLIIYQLEGDPGDPRAVLSDYEEEMKVYSILKNPDGTLIYESTPDINTDLGELLEQVEKSALAQNTTNAALPGNFTEQGGYMELEGSGGERYGMIRATVMTKEDNGYILALFYGRTAAWTLFLRDAPRYLGIWGLSLVCVLAVSRFLMKKAFGPTERVLLGQKGFVAAASHELKAPLAVIMANVESVQKAHIPTPWVQASLKTIDAECARMSRLVQDMLLLASSDADRWTVAPEDVEVDTLLITLYEAYEPLCVQKQIRLNLDLESADISTLYTDRERLFQILSIYMDNAISYSPSGASIDIFTRRSAGKLTFFVADHGSGIDKKDKPYIFDRFYRADKSHSDKSHFGLGLSITLELAKMLGGAVGFADTPAGGATFYVTLPVR